VEVVGSELNIRYPVDNMERDHVELDRNTQVLVFNFHHKINLVKAKISLFGVEDKPRSRKFSKKLPICVESSDCGVLGESHTFCIFPRLKRNKEALYSLLIRTHMGVKEEQMVNLMKRVITDCETLDNDLECINVLVNRLGANFLTQEIIYNPIQKILTAKLVNKFGYIFKTLGVKNVDLGERYPLVKRVSKPWHNERGLWAKVVISESNVVRSITVEANQLNIPSYSPVNSSCSEEEVVSPKFSVAYLMQMIDKEISNLSLTLDISQFEMVFLVNIPPPGPPQLHSPQVWIGLCHLPSINIQITASGASYGLTNILNTIMPVVRATTLRRLNRTLESKWVYPNMKYFTYKW